MDWMVGQQGKCWIAFVSEQQDCLFVQLQQLSLLTTGMTIPGSSGPPSAVTKE